MNKHDYRSEDVCELGSVTTETLGQAAIGLPDTQQGAYFVSGAIESND